MILLRGGESTLEVLLVKRTPHASFMGGVWVFPGGAVEQNEGEDDAAHRAAALRELNEEAGIELAAPEGAGEVLPLDHPRGGEGALRHPLLPRPPARRPGAQVDGEECVDLGWFTPAGALLAHERQEIALVFPTIKHLEQLSELSATPWRDLLRHASGLKVRAVQPRVLIDEGGARVVMTGSLVTSSAHGRRRPNYAAGLAPRA